RRSDRVGGRARVPDLPGAPLHGHGCDPALRGVDHAAGVGHRLVAETADPARLPLVRGGARMSFIEVRNVWQSYGEHVVLEGLNLRVDEGEFCTMVGASGCGKSTFLRLLLGQERPSRGQLLLDGLPLVAEPD